VQRLIDVEHVDVNIRNAAGILQQYPSIFRMVLVVVPEMNVLSGNWRIGRTGVDGVFDAMSSGVGDHKSWPIVLQALIYRGMLHTYDRQQQRLRNNNTYSVSNMIIKKQVRRRVQQ
jgi:hypothetical protein